MNKAALKHITPSRPAMVTPNFKRGLPLPAQPDMTPFDALRAIVAGGDYLGIDPDGCHWFLFPAPRHLAEYLEAFDSDEREGSNGGHGGTDDDEPNGDLEDDRADLEPDDDSEPDHRHAPLPAPTVVIPELRAGAVPQLTAAE